MSRYQEKLASSPAFRRPTLSDISEDGGTSYLEGNDDETAGTHGGARAWRHRGPGPGPSTAGVAASYARARSWRLRGRVRLAGCLQDSAERWLYGPHRPEPHDFAGRRCRRHAAHRRCPGGPRAACRPFLRRRGHHEAGNDPKVAGLVYI